MSVVLVTPSTFGAEDKAAVDALRAAGYEVVFNPFGRRLTQEEITGLILQYQPVGIIAGLEPLDAAVLSDAENLKVISRCGTGLDNVDVPAAGGRGIAVWNTPEAPVQSVAELTLGLMLAGLRRLTEVDTALHAGRWQRPVGSLLGSKVVGICGCGRIGSAVAGLVNAFGARLLGYDPAVSRHPLIELTSLDALLAEADIVSLHVPYTDNTRHLLDGRRLAMMKPGALLVNTSRGGIVDEEALYQAVKFGHLGGACLDVFTKEPYQGPLVELSRIVLTPHIGSYTRETRIDMEKQAVDNLLRAIRSWEG